MKSTLLPEDKLIWSPIVANSRMNRERKASGINSYEKEFKFKPEVFLESRIEEFGQASWLDLCCGQGNALLQTASYLHSKGLQDKARLTGIDLLNSFQPIPKNINCVHFESGSVMDWLPSEKYDLVTCSHGLHYLGNKLKVIETVISALSFKGLFIANLDLANIVIENADTRQFLKTVLKKEDIQYNQRTRIIKRAGFGKIKFNLHYIGADDRTGPNYTGQDAVTSHYALP